MNTNPARYAFPSTSARQFVAVENFYAKVVVELGVPGLIIVVTLFGIILWRTYTAFRRLRDPKLRAFSIAFLAFLFLQVIYFWKGSYLDIDPVNIFSGFSLESP